MAFTVQHLVVSQTADYDPRGNPFPATQYSYYIGKHGPFMDKFKQGEDTVAAVLAKQQEHIQHLQAIGASE